MIGEMAEMALEIGLEQEYWENPLPLMNYSSFCPLDNHFHSFYSYEEEDEDPEDYGAISCNWSDI